ncbi:MAG TPA: CAP domain-containing protein [Actinomycetota bacterium]|nr:CAP domain-containing protein [Actinomycetota bacterium]
MRTRLAKILLVGILIGLFIGAGTAGAETAPAPRKATVNSDARTQMQQATNRSRLDHGVHRVWLNAKLSQLALRHSLAMAAADSLFHTSDPAAYYLKGIKWRVWGENVGVTGAGVPQMESAFMASAPHRANILRPSFLHSAVGAVRSGGKLWVTVFFYG